MPQLVTGLFYERAEAERAVELLRSRGFGPDDIYLEEEVQATGEIGAKGGELSSAEQERRVAGLETGVIIGLIVGALAGFGVGMLGQGILESMQPETGIPLPMAMTNPLLAMLVGGAIGILTGAIVGWMVDFTLTRMGAGPALPTQETLVTVRVADGALDYAYASLFDARARHLHIASRPV